MIASEYNLSTIANVWHFVKEKTRYNHLSKVTKKLALLSALHFN